MHISEPAAENPPFQQSFCPPRQVMDRNFLRKAFVLKVASLPVRAGVSNCVQRRVGSSRSTNESGKCAGGTCVSRAISSGRRRTR